MILTGKVSRTDGGTAKGPDSGLASRVGSSGMAGDLDSGPGSDRLPGLPQAGASPSPGRRGHRGRQRRMGFRATGQQLAGTSAQRHARRDLPAAGAGRCEGSDPGPGTARRVRSRRACPYGVSGWPVRLRVEQGDLAVVLGSSQADAELLVTVSGPDTGADTEADQAVPEPATASQDAGATRGPKTRAPDAPARHLAAHALARILLTTVRPTHACRASLDILDLCRNRSSTSGRPRRPTPGQSPRWRRNWPSLPRSPGPRSTGATRPCWRLRMPACCWPRTATWTRPPRWVTCWASSIRRSSPTARWPGWRRSWSARSIGGRGAGRALMSAFEEHAARRGCRLIALATRRAAAFSPRPGLPGVRRLLPQGAGHFR